MVPFGRRTDGSNFRDWVVAAAAAAIADAALGPDDIDAVVVASESDFLSLQVNPASVLIDDLGLTPCPVMRVEAGGASGAAAVRAGALHVMARQAKRVLVVGFEQAASQLSGDDVRLIYGLSFDVLVDGLAGASAANLYALSMCRHMARFGTTEAQLAAVSVKNHGNARHNPFAHKPLALTIDDVLASPVVSAPYKRLDCCMISDGAAAVVLSLPAAAPAPRRPRARLAGLGCATDHARLGDRARPEHFAAKARAAADAYAMAGVTAAAIEVAEVYDPFTGAEIQGLEALGLAQEGQAAAAMAAGAFAADGSLPVNLSGGLIGQGAPSGAVGIAQLLTIERLLTGRASVPIAPVAPRLGLADTHGGLATVALVHVLERVE